MRVLVILAATLALAAPAVAAARAPAFDQGVVQTVSPGQIILRELDGSTETLVLGPQTRVLVNGFPASVADIAPGFVARIAHNGSAPARIVRAWGRLQLTVTRGVVVSRGGGVLAVRTSAGGVVSFRITVRTKVRVRGLPALVSAARPGRVVDVTHTQGLEARRIAVRPALGRG